jgi:FKBP-type peptidyl-prolyl cis-trans isomerase
VLLVSLVGLWAVGVFRVRTPEGILVVDVNEPNPDVFVDGEKVVVTWANGGKRAEIRVKPGTRKVDVKKDGFSVDGKDLAFKEGDRVVFTARLLPEQRGANADAPRERSAPPLDRKRATPSGVGGTAEDDKGFVPLFNGKDLTGWKIHPQPGPAITSVVPVEKDGKVVAYEGKLKDGKQVPLWRVEDGVFIGSGPASHLFSERGDYQNFRYRVEAQINDHGNSGQYFRTQFGPGFPKGYEAQINSTHRDPIRTGSLYPAFGKLSPEELDKVLVKEMLVPPDTWFTQEVIAEGNHIVIKVNGKTTVDYRDPNNTYTRGHFALQGHDPGTVVKFRKVEIKELQPARPQEPQGRVNEGSDPYVTTSSGLKYKDLQRGQGAAAKPGDVVTVHYTGWLKDGTKFDSSLDRDKPFTFTLNGGKVIKGWDEGVAGMKAGGKRKLIIPPNLAYGDRGAGGVIPPNAELTFEVELLTIEGGPSDGSAPR